MSNERVSKVILTEPGNDRVNGLLSKLRTHIVQFHFGNFWVCAKLSVTAYPSLSADHHKLISQNMKWKCMLQSKHLINPNSHSKSVSQFDLLGIEITDLSENENVWQRIVSQSILRMLTSLKHFFQVYETDNCIVTVVTKYWSVCAANIRKCALIRKSAKTGGEGYVSSETFDGFPNSGSFFKASLTLVTKYWSFANI